MWIQVDNGVPQSTTVFYRLSVDNGVTWTGWLGPVLEVMDGLINTGIFGINVNTPPPFSVQWKDTVHGLYVGENIETIPSEEIAADVRTELTAELTLIDVAISTRARPEDVVTPTSVTI